LALWVYPKWQFQLMSTRPGRPPSHATLNLKGLVPDEVVDVNLMKGAQREAAYRAVNPMMALPALIDGEGPILFESLAIIEYLDETHPNPPLLLRDARGRARVRGLAQIVACDSHPLIVPRVREYLEHEFKLDEPTRIKWCQHWHTAALTALEAHLKDAASGRYCHGDAITLADICLASQAAGAKFFSVDTTPFFEFSTIDAFARAHPLKQPGAPAS
jgi:maleylacetoacetate isomerase